MNYVLEHLEQPHSLVRLSVFTSFIKDATAFLTLQCTTKQTRHIWMLRFHQLSWGTNIMWVTPPNYQIYCICCLIMWKSHFQIKIFIQINLVTLGCAQIQLCLCCRSFQTLPNKLMESILISKRGNQTPRKDKCAVSVMHSSHMCPIQWKSSSLRSINWISWM